MSRGLNLRLIIVPFLYFYVLSFATILVSAYWLISTPGTVNKTYAQTGEFPESDYTLNVSSQYTVELQQTNEIPECAFGNNQAKRIDNYFSRYEAPLAGQGCAFVREGYVNGINPNIVAAIAMCESTGGKVTPQFNGVNSYNAWGWAVYDSVETIRAVQGHNCDSWEHCIGRVTRGIVSNSKERNLGVEPEDIVQWYTPASVEKGGGIPENAPWVKCVRSVMNKIDSIEIQ